MAQYSVSEEEVGELVELNRAAASVFMRGDMRRFVTLITHGDDYTLMPPTGGDPRHGFDESEEALDALENYFRGGEAELELVATYASGDIAVLVAIERQHGEVGELPPQDWSLRVTQVFRRDGSQWRLVHRHADPLVHEISYDQLAALARGESAG